MFLFILCSDVLIIYGCTCLGWLYYTRPKIVSYTRTLRTIEGRPNNKEFYHFEQSISIA